MTGNVLPNKVSTENISKVEVPPNIGTVSYLKSRTPTSSKASAPAGDAGSSKSSPRGSVSSSISESAVNGRKVCEGAGEGGWEGRGGKRGEDGGRGSTYVTLTRILSHARSF